MYSSKIARKLLPVLPLLFLSACGSLPTLVIPGQLSASSDSYAVEGIFGWQLNQTIKYGDYSTSVIDRGWKSSTEANFLVHFQSASEKISFIQKTPAGDTAEVSVIGRFKEIEYPLINDYFSLLLDEENVFAGTIKPLNSEISWDFVIYDADVASLDNGTSGYAVSSLSERIEITGVKSVEGSGSLLLALDNSGYIFTYEEDPVAAVSLISGGKIWIRNDISETLQIPLSSIMTAVLVRSGLD